MSKMSSAKAQGEPTYLTFGVQSHLINLDSATSNAHAHYVSVLGSSARQQTSGDRSRCHRALKREIPVPKASANLQPRTLRMLL